MNPYFLRLNFSHPLKSDEDASASYDAGSGYLSVKLLKETPGQAFKDLDLLAKLLAPRPVEQPASHPVIEVLSSENADEGEVDADEELAQKNQRLTVDVGEELAQQTRRLTIEQQEILCGETLMGYGVTRHIDVDKRTPAAENDWQLPQEVPEPLTQLKTTPEYQYGFLDMHTGYFRHVEHTENDINELGADAETCSPSERRKTRLKHEDQKWDEEYYMQVYHSCVTAHWLTRLSVSRADYVDDEYIQELLHWRHPHTAPAEDFSYTEEENAAMLRLPRKECEQTSEQNASSPPTDAVVRQTSQPRNRRTIYA